MKSIGLRLRRRIAPFAALLVAAAGTLAAAETGAVERVCAGVDTNAVPELLRPVTLMDADGHAETGLVDPFRRRGEYADGGVPGEDGLMRTTMGEISSEFRILAIVIPQDTNTPRAALIQFHDADEPILVHEGDLVRVDRSGAEMRGRRGVRTRASATRIGGKAARPKSAAAKGGAGRRPTPDAELEEQLRRFVFYVNVKNIEPTFIEVYHNKKRPDETIRLNW